MRSFLVALAFLTVVPVRFRELPPPGVVARSRFWYPVVGLLLGAVLGDLLALLNPWLWLVNVTAFLVLAAWVVLTGALHLDGFCDLCDGLFGGRTPEDRLRILRDPHLGTYGLAGGVLLLLGKFVVVSEMLLMLPARAPYLVVAAVVVARCLAVCLAAGARYPRPEGTGKALVEATRVWEAPLFVAVAGLAAYLALPNAWAAAGLLAPPLVAVLLLRLACDRLLGGVTGDCLGAAIELSELLALVGGSAAALGVMRL
jgi:adenosylcobinamide-GDP ribazoletransferase